MTLVVVNGTSICNCGCRWWSTWITCELICDILWDMWLCDIYMVLVIYMCCWWYICDVGDVCYIYLLFVWMGRKKQIKKVVFSHFAECNGHDTRQSDYLGTIWEHALPSANVVALGKHQRFAECHGTSTRQTLHTLPSVLPAALGKVTTFAECLSQRHSAKRGPLPSAWPWHLAKPPSWWRSTSRSLFFAECRIGTRQSLCRVPDIMHSTKRSLPINCLPSVLCRVPRQRIRLRQCS